MKTQTPPPQPLTQEAAEKQNILIYSPEFPMESRVCNFLRKHGFQSIYICSESQRIHDMIQRHSIHVVIAPAPEQAAALHRQLGIPSMLIIDLPHRSGVLCEKCWRKSLLSALLRRSEGGVK